MITEVTEKDVVTETTVRQMKEAKSMECTVEIVVHCHSSLQFDEYSF